MNPKQWPPSVRVWGFESAPPEFRALSTFGGGEECVIFVPTELLDAKGQLSFDAIPFDIVNVKEWDQTGRLSADCTRWHGGSLWGNCTLHRVDGGIVLVTKGSQYPGRD